MTQQNDRRGEAIAWFRSIIELVDTLRKATADQNPDRWQIAANARNAIIESVFSVEVRGAWHSSDTPAGDERTEYRILLGGGGPALQLSGELSDLGEPETARLEHQEWGTPWTPVTSWDLARACWPEADEHAADRERAEEYLLDFARVFYFGG